MRCVPLIVLVLVSPVLTANADTVGPGKKVIEFGWDEPDTAFMRAHIAEMESKPFDGCVFDIKYLRDGRPTGSFLSEAWGHRAFTDADVKSAVDDLRASPFRRFTENFLRFDATPGDVDWFDDTGFAAVTNNAALAARVARAGHARGILFDVEQYASPLFTYPKQPRAKDVPFADYARQVRRRGAQVMDAFQREFPGVTVLFTFGYTLPYTTTGHDPAKLATADYGLLAAFLDGMVDAAAPETRLIDGCELAYSYQSAGQFDAMRANFQTGVLPFVAAPDRYHAHFRLAFGLWLDDDWRRRGWDTADPSKNYFTPAGFAQSVRLALRASDGYVWIYTEQPRWWTASGKSQNLPPVYDAAIADAKKSELQGAGPK